MSNSVSDLRTGRGSEGRQGEDHHERQILAIQEVLGGLAASEVDDCVPHSHALLYTVNCL